MTPGDGNVGPARTQGPSLDAMRPYLATCFWLVVPILIFNLLFSRDLPAAYQSAIFWNQIPRAIAWPENGLRLAALLLPLGMRLDVRSRRGKAGLGVYLVGVAVYFSSWGALILSPNCAWSTSAVGFLAPAWTPIAWFLGILLLSGERLLIPVRFYQPWMFGLLAGAFLVFHNLHAGLVFSRLHGAP
jgi:hypothetical protein